MKPNTGLRVTTFIALAGMVWMFYLFGKAEDAGQLDTQRIHYLAVACAVMAALFFTLLGALLDRDARSAREWRNRDRSDPRKRKDQP